MTVRRLAPRAAGGFAAGIGTIALAGWVLEVPTLRSVVPGLDAMTANTAAALILAGIILWVFPHPAARAGAAAVALVGAVTLLEYLAGWNLGIDGVLTSNPDARAPGPGRMAANTALDFLLLGGALLCMSGARPRWRRGAEMLSAMVALIAMFAVVGYAFGVHALAGGVAPYAKMSLPTALALVALPVGVVTALPDSWLVARLTDRGPGGVLVRRLMPIVVGLPIALGWLRLRGQDAGWYDTRFGVAVLIVCTIVLLVIALLWSVAVVQRVEQGRRAAETSQRQTSERYYRTLDDMIEGCQIIGPDGRYLFVNKAAARQGRRPAEELVGHTMEELYPGIEGTELFAALRRCHNGQTPIQMENHFQHPDGTREWYDLRMQPVPEGVFILSVDVSARKQAEEELRRSNEELERFAYVASHDLQEPLRMVRSYVQLLAKRYQGQLDADANEFIGFAVEGAQRMQRLIEDLLAYSRVGSRGGALVPTDADAVLDNVLTDLQIAISESGATITRDRLPTVAADAGQLDHLFQNLLSNALKFRGSAAPAVHVSAAPHDGQWLFRVRDNGIGIDPKYYERVFQIFQRLHNREAYPGTGIGLAIAKKIVERHGGRIWVESQPGQGATFLFTLRPAPEES